AARRAGADCHGEDQALDRSRARRGSRRGARERALPSAGHFSHGRLHRGGERLPRKAHRSLQGPLMDPAASDGLIRRMLDGDRVALARLITIVENRDPETRRIMSAVYERAGNAYVIGITG